MASRILSIWLDWKSAGMLPLWFPPPVYVLKLLDAPPVAIPEPFLFELFTSIQSLLTLSNSLSERIICTSPSLCILNWLFLFFPALFVSSSRDCNHKWFFKSAAEQTYVIWYFFISFFEKRYCMQQHMNSWHCSESLLKTFSKVRTCLSFLLLFNE